MGIDYGRGLVNIDQVTGIRYGVINANVVGQVWYDESQFIYGNGCCHCGNDVNQDDDTCPSCGKYWADMAEPIGSEY